MTQKVVLGVNTSAAASKAVLLEVRRGINGGKCRPDAGGDVGRVLLVQPDVVSGPELAQVAADEVLPWVGQGGGWGLEVAGDVLGEVAEVDRCPPWIDDVDQHERVVAGHVDDAVVRV